MRLRDLQSKANTLIKISDELELGQEISDFGRAMALIVYVDVHLYAFTPLP